MKSYCKYIGLVLLPLFAVACDDGADKYYIDMPRPADELKLEANVDTLVLSAAQGNETVLTFKWNQVSAPVDTIQVKYLFRMGVSGSQFKQGSEFEEVPECEKSYGADDLNDLISTWGIAPGAASEFQVQVVAQYPNEDKYYMPMVSEKLVVVTTFKPVSRPAYMQNAAVDPGTNTVIGVNDGSDMTEIILGKMYSWKGWFSKNEGVYVSFSKDGSGQCIVRTGDDGCAVSNAAPSSATEKFYPPKDGYYTFSVNTKTKEAKWEYWLPTWNYDHVYIVGAGFPAGGWNISAPDELVRDSENPEVFVFDGNIADGGGEFKMYHQTGNWGNDAIMPPCSSPGVQTHVTFVDGVPTAMALIPGASPDNKFHFPSSGHWRLELNFNRMSATATKVN